MAHDLAAPAVVPLAMVLAAGGASCGSASAAPIGSRRPAAGGTETAAGPDTGATLAASLRTTFLRALPAAGLLLTTPSGGKAAEINDPARSEVTPAAISDPAIDRGHCLSRQEQRARLAAHAIVPLGKAMRSVKGQGELIRARLCEQDGWLVYLLTVLARGGKVLRATVNAGSGKLIDAPR